MAIKDSPTKVIDDVGQEYDPTDVVGYMENTYPEMTQEFKNIQREQYELFCRKQFDYGPQNIAVGTILKTKEDIKLSLLGVWFRMNDKIERLKTLLMRDDNHAVEKEGVVDSFSDVSNYGVMAQVVARGKWAK
jgi:hypothetical protein|tara:strand:- start:507 stop:905 length:399 start_codon:yes stop_codon:yes gene_type:complete